MERNVVYMHGQGIARLTIQKQHDMSNTAVMTIIEKYKGRMFDQHGNEIIRVVDGVVADLSDVFQDVDAAVKAIEVGEQAVDSSPGAMEEGPFSNPVDLFEPTGEERVSKQVDGGNAVVQLEQFKSMSRAKLDALIADLGDPSEVARTTAELAMSQAQEALANNPHDMDIAKKVSEIISRCQAVIRETSHLEKMNVDEVLALWNS